MTFFFLVDCRDLFFLVVTFFPYRDFFHIATFPAKVNVNLHVNGGFPYLVFQPFFGSFRTAPMEYRFDADGENGRRFSAQNAI